MINLLINAADWLQGLGEVKEEEVVFILSLGNLVIGYLRREEGEWMFEYSAEFKEQDRVKPIMDFPKLDRVYRSKELWPFFALRIPSLDQPNVQAFLHDHNLTETDEATMLEEFGRRSVANPFELAVA